MLTHRPLSAHPTPNVDFILSSVRCEEPSHLFMYKPLGHLWIRTYPQLRQSSVLKISPSTYTRFVRSGAVSSAAQHPDGFIISLERGPSGPMSEWHFANLNAFLKCEGTCKGESLVRSVVRVGDTCFAHSMPREGRPDAEKTELMMWSKKGWRGLGLTSPKATTIRRIGDDIVWFADMLYRWKNDQLSPITPLDSSFGSILTASIGNTLYVLQNDTLARLDAEGHLVDLLWPVENIRGLWTIDGLIFVTLGNNKRSWIAALYDPQTGKSRGFKRKDFAAEPRCNSTQWITAQNRLFFLVDGIHHEIDLSAIHALRKTKLRG